MVQTRRPPKKNKPLSKKSFFSYLRKIYKKNSEYIRNGYNKFSLFTDHLSLRKIPRLIVHGCDILCNFLLIGLFIFISFALYAFHIVQNHQNDYTTISAIFLDRHGEYIGERGSNYNNNIAIDDVPDHLIKAILATEDRRFFQHWGIDLIGIFRAFLQNSRAGSIVQGGSTLTQQLAKNIYLNNQRTFSRKINEAFIALWLENNLTKKQILQKYINTVYMGGNSYGIQSAANFYFDKDVRAISLSEAALLAGLLKAPSTYGPHHNPQAAAERANIVLSNLVNKGFMTENEVVEARMHPAKFVAKPKDKTPGYFIDWAYKELQELHAKRHFKASFVIVTTTFDPNIQKAADNAVSSTLKLYGKGAHATQAASVTIENNGAVRAIVGGLDYEQSQFNRATVAQRQTGSSFKIYVYTTLLEKTDLKPFSRVLDAPFNWNGWEPRNYGRNYHGWVSLTDAIVYSFNTVPPRLTYQYLHSTQPIIDVAHAMGVTSRLDTNRAMVLGTSGITVLEQATAYNVLANGGIAGTVHGLETIRTKQGEPLWDWSANHLPFTQVIKATTARDMNNILIQVVQRGTGRRAQLQNIPTAGKSGTSQEYRDAWFAGFTGNYTTVVWLGNDNFTPMNRITGGFIPAMIWNKIMAPLHDNIKLKPIYGTNYNIGKTPYIKQIENHRINNELRIVTYEMIPILHKIQDIMQQRVKQQSINPNKNGS